MAIPPTGLIRHSCHIGLHLFKKQKLAMCSSREQTMQIIGKSGYSRTPLFFSKAHCQIIDNYNGIFTNWERLLCMP